MMDATAQALAVSVAVLNHKRPHLLPRALTAIVQLDYANFEIVVVGDQPDIMAYELPEALVRQIRYVTFTEPNICKARNHAVRASGGEIVAFIDDDAVPEPSWLTDLVKPFDDPMVATVGGTVRASDGISIEWQGGEFDRTGHEKPLKLETDIAYRTASEQNASGTYLSLRGVNSAFRRSALIETGGFDEAIRYYLDETDMALRLAHAGWSAATARRAEVHHLLVPNASRGLLRKPGNQFEIGAGKAVFCAKHSAGALPKAMTDFRQQRLAMLDPQMRLGIVRLKDRLRVEKELDAGVRDGLNRTSSCPLTVSDDAPAFQRFQTDRPHPALNISVETGWHPATNAALKRYARSLADAGHRVSVFSFRSGPDPLSVTFRDGLWWHSGGTWTVPARTEESIGILRKTRSAAERNRIGHVRRFDCHLRAADTATTTFIELPGCRRKVAMVKDHPNDGETERMRAILQAVANDIRMALSDRNPYISAANPATAV